MSNPNFTIGTGLQVCMFKLQICYVSHTQNFTCVTPLLFSRKFKVRRQCIADSIHRKQLSRDALNLQVRGENAK